MNNSSPLPDLDHIRLSLFEILCKEHEINDQFALKLRNLQGYEIVLICDDSGSMNTPVTTPGSNPYGKLPTRWDELKQTVSIIIDISAVLDENGVNVYFLNREPLFHVTHHSQLEPRFNTKAAGSTPIVPVLRNILRYKSEKRRLIILATDGCPDDYVNPDGSKVDGVTMFKHVLEHERGVHDYMTILACTDDESVMSYLNNWDNIIKNLDVVDDYKSETLEIRAVQGPNFKFSFGDYVVKALMGAIDPWFDNLDEVCITGYNQPKALPVSVPKRKSKRKSKREDSSYPRNHKRCIMM